MELRLSTQLLRCFPSAVVWESPASHSSRFLYTACSKRSGRGTTARLVGMVSAKAWEDVPGKEHAEGSVGRDGDTRGTEALAESGLGCWPAAPDFKPEKITKEGLGHNLCFSTCCKL